jgi:hypothetical protein
MFMRAEANNQAVLSLYYILWIFLDVNSNKKHFIYALYLHNQNLTNSRHGK